MIGGNAAHDAIKAFMKDPEVDWENHVDAFEHLHTLRTGDSLTTLVYALALDVRRLRGEVAGLRRELKRDEQDGWIGGCSIARTTAIKKTNKGE